MLSLPEKKEVSFAPIRLLMVNLPAMISDLLHKVLERVDDILVVKRPVEASKLSSVLQSNAVDVILLGSSRADGACRAVEMLESLRDRPSRLKVLVLSDKPGYLETIALFRAGADGILCGADLQFDLLCKSLRCVHDGQVWANNELLKHLVASLGPPRSRIVTDSRGKRLLTNREQQVLHLLADGLSNFELAAELKLSEHTIKNHLFRIYDKLGVSNRMEAVLYALTPRAATRNESIGLPLRLMTETADNQRIAEKMA